MLSSSPFIRGLLLSSLFNGLFRVLLYENLFLNDPKPQRNPSLPPPIPAKQKNPAFALCCTLPSVDALCFMPRLIPPPTYFIHNNLPPNPIIILADKRSALKLIKLMFKWCPISD
jgi:hypothetical protein